MTTTDQRTEHGEQVALVQWCGDMRGRWPEIELLYATPNGGKRDVIVALKLRQEGVRPGVSDLFLPVPRKTIIEMPNRLLYGLWIEMKKPVGGKLSIPQLEWLIAMHDLGFATCVAPGFERGRDYIGKYMAREWNETESFHFILGYPREKKRGNNG